MDCDLHYIIKGERLFNVTGVMHSLSICKVSRKFLVSLVQLKVKTSN